MPGENGAQVTTRGVTFEGIEARLVEVQCALGGGLPAFSIVGLPDKAVSEARERVRAALAAMSIALPAQRITMNLAPADLPKEGAQFDLPIALALLATLGLVPPDQVADLVALGELSLDGRILPVPGALPAALAAAAEDRPLLCAPAAATEAAWSGAAAVFGAATLAQAIAHLTGRRPLEPARPGAAEAQAEHPDLTEIRGQERARRALEVAAAGRHHLFLVGTPGAGKTMLARSLPGLLPPLDPAEALETAMVHSRAGRLSGAISRQRPFCQPHHSASRAALTGGGSGALPGEISLAHNGVLFLDELPEFAPQVLEALRQPLETGEIVLARARARMRYPCRFLLVAAANPCRCGHLGDAARACARAPRCGEDYLGRISGPLMDRFDLRIEVPPVAYADLAQAPRGEASAPVAARVARAREIQRTRYADAPGVRTNAEAAGTLLERVATPDAEGAALLEKVHARFGLSARGYHRILRVARTIADLDGAEDVRRPHLAEAIGYRIPFQRGI
ncbi:YifB family Mg chelatase-like AAA ATPase [Phaeovulum vinaykumarii]|uniref:Magnesium chelatase family protein n=1 Tax=Phaeovulum vinaykumarii TaxID=407234 RepID=A0A1N7L3H1_9RHOB|nr:YifB family Mg chelatase-like AAA ATPase [Phaeovulum vinaykumarii]SIS68220.1 magnesium chelatase family protein [Phaeovulum vinaykumarii]SOC00225.1 magnesium chelatase family protein [Phaeovulum vinaykumarii]